MVDAMGAGLSSILVPIGLTVVLSTLIGCLAIGRSSNAMWFVAEATTEIAERTVLEEVSI